MRNCSTNSARPAGVLALPRLNERRTRFTNFIDRRLDQTEAKPEQTIPGKLCGGGKYKMRRRKHDITARASGRLSSYAKLRTKLLRASPRRAARRADREDRDRCGQDGRNLHLAEQQGSAA